jgi:hypothetical protein
MSSAKSIIVLSASIVFNKFFNNFMLHDFKKVILVTERDRLSTFYRTFINQYLEQILMQ